MGKVRYKDISAEMAEMVAPSGGSSSRHSVGMEEKVGEFYYVPLEQLIPYRNQARQKFDETELDEMASTIKAHGVRQPLSIMPSADGKYEIVSGERRFRAAKRAGLERLPCLIVKDPDQAEEIALIENIQRADLHPVELGDAYHHLLSKAGYGGMSHLARKIGKSVSTISEVMKLHELPREVKSYLIEQNIRSKITFRKLVLLESVDEMKRYLGMDGLHPGRARSVLRISLSSDGFTAEKKGIARLSDAQKARFKQLLQDMIHEL